MDPITMALVGSLISGQGMGKGIGGMFGTKGAQWGEMADSLMGGTKMSLGGQPSAPPQVMPMGGSQPNIFAGVGGGQEETMRMLQRLLAGGR